MIMIIIVGIAVRHAIRLWTHNFLFDSLALSSKYQLNSCLIAHLISIKITDKSNCHDSLHHEDIHPY